MPRARISQLFSCIDNFHVAPRRRPRQEPCKSRVKVTASVCTPVRCLGCRIITIGCEAVNAPLHKRTSGQASAVPPASWRAAIAAASFARASLSASSFI